MSIISKPLVSSHSPDSFVVAERMPGLHGPRQFTFGTPAEVFEYITIDSGYYIEESPSGWRVVVPEDVRRTKPLRLQCEYHTLSGYGPISITTLRWLSRGAPSLGGGITGFPLLMTVDHDRIESNPFVAGKRYHLFEQLPVYRIHTQPGSLISHLPYTEKEAIALVQRPYEERVMMTVVDLDALTLSHTWDLQFQLDVARRLDGVLSVPERNVWVTQLIRENIANGREALRLIGEYTR